MQFGLILAFATFALASPTPMLEDRQTGSASGSGSVSGLNIPFPIVPGNPTINSDIQAALNGLASNIFSAATSDFSSAASALQGVSSDATQLGQQVKSAVQDAVKNFKADLLKYAQSTSQSIQKTVNSTTSTAGNLVTADLVSLTTALTKLGNSLNTALAPPALASILTFGVGAAVGGVSGALKDEQDAIKKALAQFTDPLNQLTAAVTAHTAVNLASVSSVLDALNTFATALSSIVVSN